MLSVCFQGKPFNITVIQVYAPTIHAKQAEVEQFYEDLQDLLELTPKKPMSFSSQGTGMQKQKVKGHLEKQASVALEYKMKQGKRLITELGQENTLVITNTLFPQYKRHLYTCISLNGEYQSQIDYILCSQRWRSSVWSEVTRPRAECGLDHELFIASTEEHGENCLAIQV